jgi:hypothetical protein
MASMSQDRVDRLNAHMATAINAAVERGNRETTVDDLFTVDPNSLVGACRYCEHAVTYAEAEDSGSSSAHTGCRDTTHDA